MFVLTSRSLPEGTPDHVTTAPTPAALVEAIEAAGVTGDVHLVGRPRTLQAFCEIGALAEVGLLVMPRIQGGGVPLAPPGTEPLSLTLRSTRTFPDGHRGPVHALRQISAQARPRNPSRRSADVARASVRAVATLASVGASALGRWPGWVLAAPDHTGCSQERATDCPGPRGPKLTWAPDQARLPRATRLNTCRVMRPLPLPNSTRVPSPPALR